MDFSEVNLTLFAAAAVLGVAALVLHILAVVLDGRRSELVSYINVGLHVPFIVLIALSGAPVIAGVMLVLASLCVYMAAQYYSYCKEVKAAASDGGEEDKR